MPHTSQFLYFALEIHIQDDSDMVTIGQIPCQVLCILLISHNNNKNIFYVIG